MSEQNAAMNDDAAREAIRTDLGVSMLVEAGAGSGKTTLMVDRLLAYVVRGTPVDHLAAVTFTRKAASELRERLENRLEVESRSEARNDGERLLLAVALRDRDRMFVGTVHAFCGRILREHSLEAGLPPDFAELDEAETVALRSASYQLYVERLLLDNDPMLADLIALGVDPLRLLKSFQEYEQYRDVEFPDPQIARPSHETVRDKLVALLERGFALRAGLNAGERDKLQTISDKLWRRYRAHDHWVDASVFARDVSVLLSDSQTDVVQKRWGDSAAVKKIAKEYGLDFKEFVASSLQPWFEKWWAHCYPTVLRLFRNASEAALAARRRSGQLGFDDLLTETARLLQENPAARTAIGERWQHLFVDEFQDTDPVQAEVCFLIASDASEDLPGVPKNEVWKSVTPRPGSLFVVGDPKQSIYRFRRADLAVYRLVRERMAVCGQVHHLTRNFRSVPAIATLVNTHFESVFATNESDPSVTQYQAPFAEFIAASAKTPAATAGIKQYWIGKQGNASKEELIEEDAALVASWIARRCNAPGDRSPADFLVLTANKRELSAYAHELALRNVPLSATGVASSIGEVLRELLIVMSVLADPGNPVAVIAALEGWCIGCSHQDLWDAREHQLEFRITHPPADRTSVAGEGLYQLYEWWIASQQLSAASVLERVMNESGLFVLAASSELGDRSAGQLLQLVTLLRANAHTDLSAAIAAIEQALAQDEDEPALRVGRTDAVRLMNLHKAKGLEAPVVVLVAPVPQKPKEPWHATWRTEDEVTHGALEICDDAGVTIARHLEWESIAADETLREEAEHVRLLYVAVTRAKEELVVAQRASYTLASKEVRGDTSRWAPLAPVLAMQATELAMSVDEPAGRRELDVSETTIRNEIASAKAALNRASQSSYALVSVTEAAKRSAANAEEDGSSLEAASSESRDLPAASSLSRDSADRIGDRANEEFADVRLFGTLAHAAMEGALRGRNDEQLLEYIRALVWHDGPADARARELLVMQVMEAVADAKKSASWMALQSGGALAELNVATVAGFDSGPRVLSEGIIDAVGREGDGWLVVDWKFSGSDDARWVTQLAAYEAQTGAYVDTLRMRTGKSAVAQIERVGVHQTDR